MKSVYLLLIGALITTLVWSQEKATTSLKLKHELSVNVIGLLKSGDNIYIPNNYLILPYSNKMQNDVNVYKTGKPFGLMYKHELASKKIWLRGGFDIINTSFGNFWSVPLDTTFSIAEGTITSASNHYEYFVYKNNFIIRLGIEKRVQIQNLTLFAGLDFSSNLNKTSYHYTHYIEYTYTPYNPDPHIISEYGDYIEASIVRFNKWRQNVRIGILPTFGLSLQATKHLSVGLETNCFLLYNTGNVHFLEKDELVQQKPANRWTYSARLTYSQLNLTYKF